MALKNEPRNHAHREAMRRMGKRSKIDAIIDRTFKEFDRRNLALKRWKDYIVNNLDKYRDQINEKMEKDGTVIRSLVLIHQNGKAKIYITQAVRMRVDSRGELALAKIKAFLDEYQKKTAIKDANALMMVELLRDLFVSRRKEMIVTQGLLNFIRLDRKKISDERLRYAHAILQEAISSEESGPSVRLYKRQGNQWVAYHTPEAA